jgi:hypothetical protein
LAAAAEHSEREKQRERRSLPPGHASSLSNPNALHRIVQRPGRSVLGTFDPWASRLAHLDDPRWKCRYRMPATRLAGCKGEDVDVRVDPKAERLTGSRAGLAVAGVCAIAIAALSVGAGAAVAAAAIGAVGVIWFLRSYPAAYQRISRRRAARHGAVLIAPASVDGRGGNLAVFADYVEFRPARRGDVVRIDKDAVRTAALTHPPLLRVTRVLLTMVDGSTASWLVTAPVDDLARALR